MRIDSQISASCLGLPAKGSAGWADRLGIGLSACCGVHCLVTPGLLVLLPAVGGWFAREWVHWVALGLIGPVAAWALCRGGVRSTADGWWRWAPLGMGVFGLLVLAAGAWGHPATCCPSDPMNQGYSGMDAEAWRWVGVNVVGSALLVTGHAWNLMRMRGDREDRCGCPGCPGVSGMSGGSVSGGGSGGGVSMETA